MTDIQFKKLLKSVVIIQNDYQNLLEIAEDEYVKRFGQHPSEANDDTWIDVFHVGCSGFDFKTILKNAEFYKNNK